MGPSDLVPYLLSHLDPLVRHDLHAPQLPIELRVQQLNHSDPFVGIVGAKFAEDGRDLHLYVVEAQTLVHLKRALQAGQVAVMLHVDALPDEPLGIKLIEFFLRYLDWALLLLRHVRLGMLQRVDPPLQDLKQA